MGLETLPARTDASVGRTKIDLAPPPDRTHYIHAEEYNRLADAVVAMGETYGLADGSTPGSDRQALLAARVAGAPRFLVADDFDALRSGTGQPWSELTQASGALSIENGLSAPAEGMGWLKLSVAASATSVAQMSRAPLLRANVHAAGAGLVARARIKTPADLVETTIRVGVVDTSLANGAWFETTAGEEWRAKTASLVGGGTADAHAGDVSASTLYDLRIEIVAGTSVKFYIDDLEVASVSGTSVPQGADYLTLGYIRCATVNGVAVGHLLVDYFVIEGSR